MMAATQHVQLCDCNSFLFNLSTLPKFRKKWRLALVFIYSSRVLASLAPQIIAKGNNRVLSGFLHAPSSHVMDIQHNGDDDNGDQGRLINISQKCLTEIVKKKNLNLLDRHGGVKGVAKALRSDGELGLCNNAEDIGRRRDAFGLNAYQKPPGKRLFHFVMEALKDTTILSVTLSLVLGIKEHGLKEGMYDGGSTFIAVLLLVVVVSAVSNFRQSKQFEKISTVSNNSQVHVMRGGRQQKISIFDVVVGDVVCLKCGDQIPADGLFLDGYSFLVDESSMTGESEHVEVDNSKNPFLVSGTRVVNGYGRMLVTFVGMNTTWGELMSSINYDSIDRTSLQARLDKLISSIGKIGLAIAFLILVVLLVRYFTGNTEDENGTREFNGSKTKINDVLKSMMQIFSTAITIVVVVIPEGLPLAVTLTLAYSMKRMTADHAMVRRLTTCETMGSVTTICTDKTGTLTTNQMKVTNFWLGQEAIRDDALSSIAPTVMELLYQGVGLNTTGSVYRPTPGTVPEFSESPTEKAILSWAVSELGMNMDELRKSCTILHVETFNSEKKRSGVSMRKKGGETIHVHWKGAAEMIQGMCSYYYDSTGMMKVMDEDERMKFKKIIQDMATDSLRCIAFAHKQIPREEIQHNDKIHRELNEDRLTLLGLVGLKDPCQTGVKEAVEACTNAGINIKMITGDNVFTARAIATECGILKSNEDMTSGGVVQGEDFQNYTPKERMDRIDRICVMARSSPFDKLLMVQCLKQKGYVVAVTGDGTNDAPALKEADIGLSMGIQGTEVAKESSDIVILDDNFASIVMVLRWGRYIYNNIQKFIQLQLTVNVSALVINFVAVVSTGEVILTPVQLLWVNFIDILGAFALATERPTKEFMKKPLVGRTKPLVTNIMWRNLMAQALYQIAIILIIQYKGKDIFTVSEKVKDTLIFNTFVLCQIFNEFNSRKLENKNVFMGILHNWLFMGIVGITLILQVVMLEFLKKFTDTEKLNLEQWAACIGIAAVSWPIGWVFKCIPVPEKPLLDFLKW